MPHFLNIRSRWYDFLRVLVLLPLQYELKGRTTKWRDYSNHQYKIFKFKFYCMEQNQENLDNLENMRRQLNTSTRGFASMDPERQRQIAREGGKAAHVKGTAHEFNSEEARNAGRKGGETVSRDREHMAEIGRKGGRSSGNSRKPEGETRDSF